MIKIKINEGRFTNALTAKAQSLNVKLPKPKEATTTKPEQQPKPAQQSVQEQEPTQIPSGWNPKKGTEVKLNNVPYRVSKNGNWVIADKTGNAVDKRNLNLLNALNLEAYKIEWRQQNSNKTPTTISESLVSRWKQLVGIRG